MCVGGGGGVRVCTHRHASADRSNPYVNDLHLLHSLFGLFFKFIF